MKRGFGLLMALVVLGLAFGCGGEEKQESQDFAYCRSNEDCPQGATCESGYCSCRTDEDCRGESQCDGGYCCQGFGYADSPCAGAGYMSYGPPSYTIPGLYCSPYQDAVAYYEEQTYPCTYGATCYEEQRELCAAGSACRNREPGVAECAPWEGKAACARVQNGLQARPCESLGLHLCRALYTEQGDPLCIILECQAERWATFRVGACAELGPNDCDCAFDLGFAGARTDGDADSENAEAEGEAVEGDQTKSKERK